MADSSPASDQDLKWPSQDRVDRSNDFAIIIGLHKIGYDAESFQEAFVRAVDESLAEAAPDSSSQAGPPTYYQIGPAAEGLNQLYTYIITIAEHAQAVWPIIVEASEELVAAEVIRRTFNKLKAMLPSFGSPDSEPTVILTPYDLTQLCLYDVRRRFHPRAKLTADWSPITTEFWYGYRSPGHPTESMEYNVMVKAGRKTYSYVVNGVGEVYVHTMKEGQHVVSLDIPNLLENGQRSQQ